MLYNYKAWEYFWHPVCTVNELAESDAGRGQLKECLLLGKKIVVARLEKGVAAFQHKCAHRSAALRLGWVDGNCIRCPYHAWTYDSDGKCIDIPSYNGTDNKIPPNAKIERYEAEEKYGLVWVRLKAGAQTSIPVCHVANEEGYHYMVGEPAQWETSPARSIEGFMDLAHFPFVHEETLGNIKDGRVNIPSDFQTKEGVLTFSYYPHGGQRYGGASDGSRVELSHNEYELYLPFCIVLNTHTIGDGKRVIWMVTSPVEEGKCRNFFIFGLPEQMAFTEEWLAFQYQIISEDDPVVQSQEPAELPDIGQEMTLLTDKQSMLYRRVLKRLSDAAQTGPEMLSEVLSENRIYD